MSKVVLLAILLFALSGVITTDTPPAYATANGVQVISDEVQVNFPRSVTFTLEAAAQTEIEEITLFYKGAASEIWSYSYPTFKPGMRIKATFNLLASVSQYLPSGADIVYYYTVRDSQGQITETKERVFTYLDARFRWNTTQVGPLTILWHDLPEGRVSRVTQQVSAALNRTSDLLRIESEEPLKGVIYNSMSEAQLVFPSQSQTLTRERVFQGYAFPQWGVFLGVGFQTGLITHESAHLLLSQVTSSPGTSIPAWVDEGFASYVATSAHLPRGSAGLPRSIETRSMPLRTMSTIPGTERDIRAFYRKAESVVAFMVEELGGDKFRSFLGHLDQRKKADQALRSAYGFGIDEIDKRWATGASGSGAASNDRSFPYWAINSVILGSLVLVVSTFIVMRATFNRLRKSPEPLEDEGDDLFE